MGRGVGSLERARIRIPGWDERALAHPFGARLTIANSGADGSSDCRAISAEDDMIKWLRIQNFRSLVDVAVELDPLTVLIGRSGTGKSNFVNAIRFLRDSLNVRQMNVSFLGGPQRVLHVDHLRDPLVYDLRFSIARIDESFEYH